MAWTTPRTWTTAEVPTAAIMNAHIRDNLNSLVDGFFIPSILFFSGSGVTSGNRGSAANNQDMYGWGFTNGLVGYILTHTVIPSYLDGSCHVYMYWAGDVAGGGGANTRWNLYTSNVVEGDQIDEAATETDSQTLTVPATAESLDISPAFSVTTGIATGGITRICVERESTHVDDNFAGDPWFFGLLIQKA